MRSYIAVAALAAGFMLTPVAAGYAPALSQDFSITNQGGSARVEGAQLDPDWLKALQAWWDLHAYYPKEASDKDEAGIVKVHIVVQPDGEVFLVKVEQGSGSKALDTAAFWTFHGGHLRPFPPGTPAPQADVYISLHYILTHPHGQPVAAAAASAPPKGPFTITNDAVPSQNTVVSKMLQRTCTGMEVRGGQWPNSIIGEHKRVTAIFYRKPDGSSWLKFLSDGDVEKFIPVTELGVSAQWTVPIMTGTPYNRRYLRYAVWPDGNNHLGGVLDGGEGLDGTGVIDMTCQTETVPQITSAAALENP